MRRLILSGLSLLLTLIVTETAVRAEHMAVNPDVLGRTSTFQSQVTPFNLVFLAYQGYFKDQGIPAMER